MTTNWPTVFVMTIDFDGKHGGVKIIKFCKESKPTFGTVINQDHQMTNVNLTT